MNKDFLDLYEELSRLNEAKADTQKLVDFVGADYADKFLAIKHRLKSPENDLYYWIKNKEPQELIDTINNLESTATNKEVRDESKSGGILVAENEDWKVYHITTFEASQFYGRDTKWCITGIDNNGDKQWKDYHDRRGVEFYFFIKKNDYNNRGTNSKYALAVWPIKKAYEIYDQQDNILELSKAAFMKEIDIPGVDFSSLTQFTVPEEVNCEHCGNIIYICDNDKYKTENNDTEYYHELCWYEKFDPEKLKDFTELYIRTFGVIRATKYLSYDEALNFILRHFDNLTKYQKDDTIIYWSTLGENRERILELRGGKIELCNDSDLKKAIEQALK